MRKLLAMLGCLSLGILLVGCDGKVVDANVAKVQAATVKLCGYVPVASVVASVIAGVDGGTVATVASIAGAVCAAVQPKANKLATKQPFLGFGTKEIDCDGYVKDVCIKGSWVVEPKTEEQKK